MTSRRSIAFSLLLVVWLPLAGSCSKPKEASYQKLLYRSGSFLDPETNKPFDGIARDFFKDGKLKGEFPMKNGKFHGLVREWHANGAQSAETEFENGERTGRNREWLDSGKLYMERVYDHDRIVSEKKH